MARASALESFMVKPIVITASRTLTDSDSGKTYFLNAAAGFTLTLPAPRQGLTFEFIVKTAPTSDHYTITSKGSEKVIRGKVVTSNVNAGTGPNVENDGVSNIKFFKGRANIGSTVELVSDGTYWYCYGFAAIWDAIYLAEQSKSPSISTSRSPSESPSVSVSLSPSISLSRSPSVSPSRSPSVSPSVSPSASPS